MEQFEVKINQTIDGVVNTSNTQVFNVGDDYKKRAAGLQFLIDLGAEAGNPAIEVTKHQKSHIAEYAKRTGAKAVDGFTVRVGGEDVYSVFILSNGTITTENLFSQLVEISGNAVAEASFLRTSVKKLQQFAHAVRQNLAAYKNSYGELTEEQKTWMRDNTISFEQEMEVAKAKAALQLGQNVRKGGENNDN